MGNWQRHSSNGTLDAAALLYYIFISCLIPTRTPEGEKARPCMSENEIKMRSINIMVTVGTTIQR